MDIIKSNRIKELIKSIDKDFIELQSILNEYKNKKFVMDLAIIPDYKIDDLTKDKWIKYFEENGIEFIDSSKEYSKVFKYLIQLDELEADKNEYGHYNIVLEKEPRIVIASSFEFDSVTELTLQEINDKIEGTKGVISISGDIKDL